MAVTLPIVGDSEGTWGTTLNQAITGIDLRVSGNETAIGPNPYTNPKSLDTRLSALEAPPTAVSVQMADDTQQTANQTTSQLGNPVVGAVFTCPPSGRVRLSLSAGVRISTIGTGGLYVGCRIWTGSTLGSGTLVADLMNVQPGCRVAISGYAGFTMAGTSTMADTAHYPLLVAGSTYNATVYYFVTATTLGYVLYRQIGVDPLH